MLRFSLFSLLSLLLLMSLMLSHTVAQTREVYRANYQKFEDKIIAKGYISNPFTTDLYSEETGVVVNLKSNGSHVEKGEIIIQLKDDLAKLHWEQQRMALEATEIKLRQCHFLLKATEKRMQQHTKQHQTLSQQVIELKKQDPGNVTIREMEKEIVEIVNEVENSKQQLEHLQMEQRYHELLVRQQEIRVKEADIQLSQHKLRATSTGVLSYANDVKVGTLLPKKTHVATILGAGNLQAVCFVPDRALHTIKLESRLKISTGGDRLYRSSVVYIAPRIEDKAESCVVIATLQDSEPHWKPGTKIHTEIVLETAEYLVIPEACVVYDFQQRPYVFIKDRDKIRRSDFLELGTAKGKLIWVKKGLRQGDQVVMNHYGLDKE